MHARATPHADDDRLRFVEPELRLGQKPIDNECSDLGGIVHNISAEDLDQLVRSILFAAGADERNANRVAEALVSSNLSGVDTHGVFHLPGYVSQIRSGELVPTAWPAIVRETPNTALVKGNWTFGHVVAKYTMDVAIRKAHRNDIGIASHVQAMHIGRVGEYAEMAASQGTAGFVLAGDYGVDEPVTVPYGGREPVLHTNPLSMGFPADQEPSLVFDFATTAAAGSKVQLAQLRGQQIPPEWRVDEEGNPTTDPTGFPEKGGLVPFGRHKGYGIMLANEVVGRVLSGADSFVEAGRGSPSMRYQGVTMIAFRADLFQPLDRFKGKVDALVRQMRAVSPAPGFDEVLVPGDPESRARDIRRRDGIPIPDEVWDSLTNLARSLKVEVG